MTDYEDGRAEALELSIVLPCLNEEATALPRYFELLMKRGSHCIRSELKRMAQYFSVPDFLDLQVLFNLIQLHPRIDCSDIGILIQWITDDQGFQAILQFTYHYLHHRFLYEETGACATDVSLVEENAVDDTFYSLIDRRIFKNDIGVASEHYKKIYDKQAADS